MTKISVATYDAVHGRTSRSRPIKVSPDQQIYKMDEIITFNIVYLHGLLTEETLPMGNISTHLLITTRIESRANILHQEGLPVIVQLYNKDTNLPLYKITMDTMPVTCRPNDKYHYNSIKTLPYNHYDIIGDTVTIDWQHEFATDYCG